MASKKPTCNPPMFGLGLWKVPIDICADLVYDSIKLGVRHLDCACDYGNEVQVGAGDRTLFSSQSYTFLTNSTCFTGITRAIAEGIVTRGDLFITSKLWNTFHRKQHVLQAAKRSLHDLNIQYFDLYLVHFPISMRFVPFEVRYPPSWVFDPTMAHPAIELDRVPFAETWTAMEELSTLGIAKNIGEICSYFEHCTISSNPSPSTQ
jgi:D-xylose reductase